MRFESPWRWVLLSCCAIGSSCSKEVPSKEAVDGLFALTQVEALYMFVSPAAGGSVAEDWVLIRRSDPGFRWFQEWINLLRRHSVEIDTLEVAGLGMAFEVKIVSRDGQGKGSILMWVFHDIYELRGRWFRLEAGKLQQIQHIVDRYGTVLDKTDVPAEVLGVGP